MWVGNFRTTQYYNVHIETFACIPNLCSTIIHKQSVALFSDTVSALVKKYIESRNNFFTALQKIVLAIQKKLFKLKNSFSDELNFKC